MQSVEVGDKIAKIKSIKNGTRESKHKQKTER
jgi:hypothetical protein